jgi:hypothetical protein
MTKSPLVEMSRPPVILRAFVVAFFSNLRIAEMRQRLDIVGAGRLPWLPCGLRRSEQKDGQRVSASPFGILAKRVCRIFFRSIAESTKSVFPVSR